jgi:nitrogen regulatory protein PII
MVRAMKMITAIIRPFKLDDLELAVAQLGVQGMTILEVRGYGAELRHLEIYRAAEYQVDFVSRIQVQIAVDESIVEPVVEAIANVTRTGKVGDGRIFVSGIEQAIRIRTGETGVAAT